MARNGAFANVDAAMMVHPGDYNTSGCEAMAVAILSVEFHGKASHAAGAPQEGINALEAMIISYNAINSLKTARGRREPGPRDHHGRRAGGERGAGAQRGAVLHSGEGR